MKSLAYSLEKREYNHIGTIGIDQEFSNGDDELIPIIYYSYMYYFKNPNLYSEFTITAMSIDLTFGMNNDLYDIGISPVFEYLRYSYFDKGFSYKKLIISGNTIGPKFYIRYNWLKIFSTAFEYHLRYYFYKIPLLIDNSNQWVSPPNNHFEQSYNLNFTVKNLSEKNLMRIKHGYLVDFWYKYTHRIKYGSFWDWQADIDLKYGTWVKSTINSTHKLYFTFGAYYNFNNDYNILFDIFASYQYHVDRNNAEQIGSFSADHAVIPGYYYSEFYHDKYIITKIQFGVPILFWDTRIQPGFNILYMPKENHVIGIKNYPKTIYRSVSLGISLKLFDILPFFFDYGYGFDAQRKHNVFGKLKSGCHEINTYVLFAF